MKQVHTDISLNKKKYYLFIVSWTGLLYKHLIDISKFDHFDCLL